MHQTRENTKNCNAYIVVRVTFSVVNFPAGMAAQGKQIPRVTNRQTEYTMPKTCS